MTRERPGIRPLAPGEEPSLAPLLEEMQAHYAVPCPPREEIVASLASLPPGAGILVAEAGGDMLGFAAFARLWPGPGLRKGLFLKELYVARSARGLGLGTQLLAALAATAVREGYGRIDWTAARDDPALRRFYEGLGGAVSDRLFFRLAGESLLDLARRDA